jgi:glycosyltransferase involved in cell wall biosynthesis
MGGVHGMALQILRGLTALGHTVDCYVARLDRGLPRELEENDRIAVQTGASRWTYDAWYNRTPLTTFVSGQVTRAASTWKLADGLAANHARRPYDVVYQFSNIELLGLRRHLKRLPPLVLHPETHLAGELAGFRRERALSRKCESRSRRAFVGAMLLTRAAVQRRDIHRATTVICPSRAFRDCVTRDYGLNDARTVVVRNPIDLSTFRPRSSARRAGPLRIVYVGRISVRKGIDDLVSLSGRLADLSGDVSLEIVGDRTQWSDYRPLLEHLDPRVAVYRGPVAAEDIPDVLAGADLLVQPSTYEPFGLTLAEGLASGVPAVATTEVGAGEDVERGCVERVPPNDAASLEAACRRMIDRVLSDASSLSADSRSEAERLFDPIDISRQIADILAEAST